MIGGAIAARPISTADLRDLASEWDGNRPAASGARSGGLRVRGGYGAGRRFVPRR